MCVGARGYLKITLCVLMGAFALVSKPCGVKFGRSNFGDGVSGRVKGIIFSPTAIVQETLRFWDGEITQPCGDLRVTPTTQTHLTPSILTVRHGSNFYSRPIAAVRSMPGLLWLRSVFLPFVAPAKSGLVRRSAGRGQICRSKSALKGPLLDSSNKLKPSAKASRRPFPPSSGFRSGSQTQAGRSNFLQRRRI